MKSSQKNSVCNIALNWLLKFSLELFFVFSLSFFYFHSLSSLFLLFSYSHTAIVSFFQSVLVLTVKTIDHASLTPSCAIEQIHRMFLEYNILLLRICHSSAGSTALLFQLYVGTIEFLSSLIRPLKICLTRFLS